MSGHAMTKALAAAAVLLALGAGAQAQAAETVVKMLNKGQNGVMVFEPELVTVAPGDTVRFVPTDKGHNVESLKGMLPDGAAPFAGKFNEEIVVAFAEPGVYGYQCRPHYGMGMVGAVVVGEPVNLDEAKAVKQRGRAKKAFERILGGL